MFTTTQEQFNESGASETLGIVCGDQDIEMKMFHKSWAQNIADTRQIALDIMCDAAKDLGADAVVAVRFTTSTVGTGHLVVSAYGSAVKFV